MTNTAQSNIIPMTSNSTTTSTSRDTQPGVSRETLKRLLRAYNEILGNMTNQVGWYLNELMEQGMEVEVIINAINETGWAQRPSPRYLKCILERYRDDEIMTMDDLRRDQRLHDVHKRADEYGVQWWM